jgi:hypothetical protein
VKVSLHTACQQVEKHRENLCRSSTDIEEPQEPRDRLFIREVVVGCACCCCPTHESVTAVDDEGALTLSKATASSRIRDCGILPGGH